MQAGGDILVTQKEAGQNPFSIDLDIATTDTGTKNLVPLRTNFSIYVQKITVSPIVGAAQALTFQDNGAPVKIAVYTGAVSNTTPVSWDFGPHGAALTVSKQFDVSIGGAGLAVRIHVEGYMKLANVISANAGVTDGSANDAQR